MAVVIGEIVTETVLTPTVEAEGTRSEPDLDVVVRRAVERVMEILRREWDR